MFAHFVFFGISSSIVTPKISAIVASSKSPTPSNLQFDPSDDVTRHIPTGQLAFRRQILAATSALIAQARDLRAGTLRRFSFVWKTTLDRKGRNVVASCENHTEIMKISHGIVLLGLTASGSEC